MTQWGVGVLQLLQAIVLSDLHGSANDTSVLLQCRVSQITPKSQEDTVV